MTTTTTDVRCELDPHSPRPDPETVRVLQRLRRAGFGLVTAGLALYAYGLSLPCGGDDWPLGLGFYAFGLGAFTVVVTLGSTGSRRSRVVRAGLAVVGLACVATAATFLTIFDGLSCLTW